MFSKDRFFSLFASSLVLLVLFFAACAKVVSPTGGARDITPPKLIKTIPPNQSTNFNSKTIRITFDEYVVLNNPIENITFSPPVDKQPEYTTSGKSVIIKLTDTLLANTTYNIVFAEAIKDFNEGNLLSLYQYAFSTGDSIDSYFIEGEVINSETLEPEKGCFVFLYSEDIDSLPLTTKPTYLTKSQSNGHFLFTNIKEGDYKIFALKDINANLIFDLPNESIAFLDYTIPSYPQPDTASVTQDSTVIQDTFPKIQLRMFMEEDTVQQVNVSSSQKGIYNICYKRPFSEHISTQIEDFPTSRWLESINPTKDTVTVYILDEFTESLMLIIEIDARIDTLYLSPPQVTRGRGRTQEKEKLRITASNSGEIYQPLTLNFSYPVVPVDSFEVVLITKAKNENDTTTLFYSITDSMATSVTLPLKYEEKKSYSILIKDSVFYGYNDITNDTLLINFTTKTEKDYGDLIMDYRIADPTCDYVIYLLSGKNIIQKNTILSSEKIKYSHLKPGDYTIKVLFDSNRNGKWDTGDYRLNRQPETILFFGKTINIRGYWEVEEQFDL